MAHAVNVLCIIHEDPLTHSSRTFDVAIVGAGIVGLAHAYAAARRGLTVAVFDRSPRAVGASIRNFGMIWPIGQPTGSLLERALRSRAIWQTVSEKAGFGLEPCGSLHLAYRQDEWAVLEEFVSRFGEQGYDVRLLSPTETIAKSPAVNPEGLLGSLWSSTEMTVDPREAIRKLPDYLHQTYGVSFFWGDVVTGIDYPHLTAGGSQFRAERIWVCSGADFETLYPEAYRASGITKVKLQMMRTGSQAQHFRIGPSLCGGLTLTHYGAFATCQSLSALKDRIEQETPHFPNWGIHVMISQNAAGECVIGDSHEYGLDPQPFDRAEIDNWILGYLKGFAQLPSIEIAERWHGIYAKIPGRTEWIHSPEAGVTAINALSGAGMTLSFGLATEHIEDLLT